jgi:nucleoside-diphosphate-sugar epimerase
MREPARATERFLVTGALGCIGAWTVRALLDEGVSVVAFDKSEDVHRLRLLLEPDELAALTIVRGDITSLASIEAALDDHVPSVGVRPMTVYGPGRDQGMTSGPTRAILAALVGRPFRIAFGGSTLFQFAPDAAAAIIAAARARPEGSPVFNLTGAAASIDEFVAAVADVIPGADRLITHEPTPLPFPDVIDADGLAAVADVPVTPLADGIRRTIELFQRRLAGSGLDPDEHGLEPVPVST